MNAKKYALYDTATNEYLCGDGGWVWASPYTAKCKFNHFLRYGLGLPAFSKQERVVVQEVVLVDPAVYEELEDSHTQLLKLEAAGVDNWSGYSEALYGDEEGDW